MHHGGAYQVSSDKGGAFSPSSGFAGFTHVDIEVNAIIFPIFL